jgi:hypothetical protein
MYKTSSFNRVAILIFASVFLFSFLTVEIYQSSGYPWLRFPGFSESNAELAVAVNLFTGIKSCRDAQYLAFPYSAPFAGQTTLFLHIYRGPPSTAV